MQAEAEIATKPISAQTPDLPPSLRFAVLDQGPIGPAYCLAAPVETEAFSLATFVVDARNAASLYTDAGGCAFAVSEVEPLIGVTGNRELLLAALVNLLQNAFKFTHSHTEVTLSAYADDDRLLTDVKDTCGGLPLGALERMFMPFKQSGNNRNGLGDMAQVESGALPESACSRRGSVRLSTERAPRSLRNVG